MKFNTTMTVLFLIFFHPASATESKKVTKADTNDYIDCAAFYASAITSLTTQGVIDEAREISLKERSHFFLETAKIYSGTTELNLEMKSRFVTMNKEYVASAYPILKNPDESVYANFLATRIAECKTMLDVNAKVLVEKQKLRVTAGVR